MVQTLIGFLVAFALGLALSRVLRRSLFWLRSRERKPGKERLHRLFPKPKRPLGGGLAMMIAATAALVLVPLVWGSAPRPEALWVLPVAWAYAVIGLVDDLRKAGGRGLRERPKFLLQLGAALLFGLLLWGIDGRDELRLPFAAGAVPIGPLYAFVAALVVLSTANATNLSDGMDGLAGGGLVIAFAGLAAIGYLDPTRAVGPVVWPFCGATLGFLVFNVPPARLLMGDTGALGMGAALGAAAIFAQSELWLPLLAAPFVVNAASVLVQMGTVRGLWRIVRPLRHSRTETARPFLCTPLHHHFQYLAWSDKRILALYWGFGALMAAWALLALYSGLVWLVGIAIIAAFLLAAALQKLISGSYFIGLVERPDQPPVVGLYCGLPLEVLGWRLHRLVTETSITEGMLVGATAESILWRPISEVEARVILGRIYADQRLFDEALAEWEQVPTRNLLLRPSVMLRMARIYYGRDRLLEAIKLWEQLPETQLAEMPNVREVVRSAKLRLADVANKSHRQAMRLASQAGGTAHEVERVETNLSAARKVNQELLSLLLYESGKVRGRAVDPEAARARREQLRHSREVVLERVRQLDGALAELARPTPAPATEQVPVHSGSAPPARGLSPQQSDPAQRTALDLGVQREDLLRLLGRAGQGEPEITQVAVYPKASRNIVHRISVQWSGSGPTSVIAKLYAADRIELFAACYRREEGVLALLSRYGASVPRVYSGELWQDRGLLLLEDLGDETLAERLEASEPLVRRQWLHSAVSALVALHGVGHQHLRELAQEIRKVEKEVLRPEYYLNALRIAVSRIGELADTPVNDSEWGQLAEQARPLIDLLTARHQGFVHFEFAPHHLLLGRMPPLPDALPSAALFAFDFEQATIGPLEFDLATLLVQPESVGGRAALDWRELIEQYHAGASGAGIPLAAREQFDRGVAYAALLKSLGYAGAAANFLAKFGGEYHLQRLHHYLGTCDALMQRWPPLRPLAQLLAPRFRAARRVVARAGVPARDHATG